MIEANKSYAIVTQSDLLRNIATDFIVTINDKIGIYRKKNLFGKYIDISDIATPSKNKLVLSYKERNEPDITNINIDESIVPFTLFINNYNIAEPDQETKDIITYLKHKSKRTNTETTYYNISVLLGFDKITHEQVDRVFDKKYLGIHTTTEIIDTLVDFVNQPSEVKLHKLISTTSDFQRLINAISTLTNDTPEWVTRKYGDLLDTTEFVKSILKISLIAIRAENLESFILQILNDIIYQ